MLGQQSAGFMQARLHRSLTPSDRSGDLTLAQVGVVAQDDDDPQMRWQVL